MEIDNMNVENLKTELWPLDKIIPSNERKGESSRLAQKRRKGRMLQEETLRQNLKKGLKIL